MSGINNNQFFQLNSKRFIQIAPTKQVVENACGEGEKEIEEVASVLNTERELDKISFMDIDQKLFIDLNNITIISSVKTKQEAEKSDEESSIVNDGIPAENTSNDDEIGHVDDNTEIECTATRSYSKDTLKNVYNLSDKDISNFFEIQGDKYVIKKSAVKSCFDKEDIDTVQNLFDAIKNIGYTEGYVRGAYGFSQEPVDKFLILVNQNPKRYTLNQEAIKAQFPDSDFKTLGQLKEAIESNNITTQTDTTDIIEDLPSYTKDKLMNTYKFSGQDISIYFIENDGKYVVNNSFIKESLSNQNIRTVEELLNCLQDAQYSDGIVRGLFGFDDDASDEFLNITTDGKYVLDKEALKNAFPDEDIKSLGQLKQAIQNYGPISTLSDEKKSQFLIDLKSGFLNGDADWGFAKLAPSEEQVEDLYQKLLADEDIINFAGKPTEFKKLIKAKSAELIKDIRDQITLFTEGELKGRQGMSELAIQLFFNKDENGNYKMDMEKINNFWGDCYKRDNMEKLKDFVNNCGLGKKRNNQVFQYIIDTLKNDGSCLGVSNLSPELTENELESLYWRLVNRFEKGDKSLYDVETTIRDILPDIMNNIELGRFEAKIDGDEFDRNVTRSELLEHVNSYRELLKTEFCSYDEYHLGYRCKYTEKYIDDMLDFIIGELGIENGSSTNNMASLNTLFNLKDVLADVKNNINILTSGGSPLPYGLHQYKNLHDSGAEVINKKINEWQKSNRISEKYFAKIFTDFFNDTGLDDNEREQYLKKLAREFYPKYMEYDQYNDTVENYGGTVDLVTVLESYNLSELYTKLQSERKNIRHIDQSEIDATTTVNNLDKLFSGRTSMDAKYIFEHLDEMLISSEPDIRNFAQILSQEMTTLDQPGGRCCSKQQKINSIKWMLVLLNEELGNQDSLKGTLTQDVFKKLGDNAFDKIRNIQSSQKYVNCYLADIDGEIGDFRQGKNGTGDCWLLSGIAAINSTPAGKQLIKDSIKWSSDYTAITITFPASGDSVTVTLEELINADPDLGSGKYNYGDNDVLAIVLAYEKLYGDIEGDDGDTFLRKFLPNADHNCEKASGIDDLFSMVGGIFGIGDNADIDEDNVIRYLQNILRAKQSGHNVAATFSLFTSGDTNYTWTTVDGKQGSANLDHGGMFEWGGHTFAITDITSTTVTFINPWQSTKSYTVAWHEFAKIGIGEIAWSVW